MARSAQGQITYIDVSDGVSPISAFMTNENHSFTATEAGVVDDRAGFSSELIVFVGEDSSTYTDPITANNQHRITSVAYVGTSTGWGTPTNTSGVVRVPSITTSAVPNVVIRVTFDVRNNIGVTVTGVTLDITLGIVRQGAGGQAISLEATHQAFFADETGAVIDNATTNPDIEINILSAGQTGNWTFAVSQNGGDFNARTQTGTGAGQIAAYDMDGTGNIETTGNFPTAQGGVMRLRVTRANFGTNRTMAIRVQGASGGVDVITLFRVQQGNTGNAAILVDVTTTSPNGTVFRNALGDPKVTIANVIDSGTGMAPTTTITYDWQFADGTPVRVTSSSNFNVLTDGSGVLADGNVVNTDRIIVGNEDVTGTASFICMVSVADS